MGYRVYTQPLVEYSNAVGSKGELIVNTNSGHVSLMSNDEHPISSTKNTEANLELQKDLCSILNELIDEIESTFDLNDFTKQYTDLKDAGQQTLAEVTVVQSIIRDLKNTLATIESMNSGNAQSLWLYYIAIKKHLDDFVGLFPNYMASTRKINELTYIDSKLVTYKNNLSSQRTSIASRYSVVKANVDSRVDISTYNSYKTSLINKYKALNSNSKVQSINFK